jgi:DNA-binding response OmpR family regulator
VQPTNEKYSNQANVYDDSCLHIEHKRYLFTVKGTQVVLSKTEFRVLSRLIRGIDSVVAFEELWDYAWGRDRSIKRKNIHVLISKVRRKLAPFGVRVDSVVGVGYILSHGSCCTPASKVVLT